MPPTRSTLALLLAAAGAITMTGCGAVATASSSTDPAAVSAPTLAAESTAAPLYQCLTLWTALDGLVEVANYPDRSTCSDAQLFSDLQGGPSGRTIQAMPGGYSQVCLWAPYRSGGTDHHGGSAWADSPAGAKTARTLCAVEKPAPTPTPALRCLPQTDAVVQKDC